MTKPLKWFDGGGPPGPRLLKKEQGDVRSEMTFIFEEEEEVRFSLFGEKRSAAVTEGKGGRSAVV